MSAKKRVFDKDLGVELVLDDEDETAARDDGRAEQNDEASSRGRKRAKFDSNQSSSNQKFGASQQSRISNLSNQTTYSRVEQAELPKESTNLVDVSDGIDLENYEDIDYGDDDDEDDDTDDDQDYNSDNHKEKQSQESKSVSEVLNYEDLDNDYDYDFEHDDSEGEMSTPKRLAYEYEKEQERERRKQEKFQRELERNSLEQSKSESGQMKMDDGGGEQEKSAQEKCKFWPNCTAGSDCSYYHPTKQCRTFPNCRFGKKCLYIHPPCKFNPCTRPGCLFAHPTATSYTRRNTIHPEAAQQPLAARCKYGFNCMNLMCKFSHQRSEPCRFGANCLLDTCAYTHPSDVVRKKPTNAFKWSAQS